MRVPDIFLKVMGGILILVAAAKSFSYGGNVPYLDAHDPIFELPFRRLLLAAGFVEGAVGLLCLVIQGTAIRAWSVLWLASMLAMYRIGLVWVGYLRPCLCLGTLTDRLHLDPVLTERALIGLVAVMFIGCVIVLYAEQFPARRGFEMKS